MLSIEKCYEAAANQQARYQALIYQFGALRIAGLSTEDLQRCFNSKNNSHMQKAITESQKEKNNEASKETYKDIIETFLRTPECGALIIKQKEKFEKFVLEFFMNPITFNVDHERSDDPFKISNLYENIESVVAMDFTKLHRATQAFALLQSHNEYHPLTTAEDHNIFKVQEKLTALGEKTKAPIDAKDIIANPEDFYLELQKKETQKTLVPYFIPYLNSKTLESKPVNMDSTVWQEILDVYNDISRCMGKMHENDPFEIYIGSKIKNVERAQLNSNKKYESMIDQFRALRRLGLTTEDLIEVFPRLQEAIEKSMGNQYTAEATRAYHQLKLHVAHFFGEQKEKIRSGIRSSLLTSPVQHPFQHVNTAIQNFYNATNQEKVISKEIYEKIEPHLMAILIIDGNSKRFDKAVQIIAPGIKIRRFIHNIKKLERAKEESFQRTLVNHIATHLPTRTLAIENPKLIHPNVWELAKFEHRMRMLESARLDASEILALQAAGKSTATYFDNKNADKMYIESVYKRIAEHNEQMLKKPPAPSISPVKKEEFAIKYQEPTQEPQPNDKELNSPMHAPSEKRSWLLRLFIWFLELIQTEPKIRLRESEDTPPKYYTFNDSDDPFNDVDEPPPPVDKTLPVQDAPLKSAFKL